jgi:hypothetical protein
MTLMRHHIQSLRLRPDAPFPSDEEDAQHKIRSWRHEQLIKRLDKDAPAQDDGDDPLWQGEDDE